MTRTFRRRFFAALVISLIIHVAFASQARRVGFELPDAIETVTIHRGKIVKWVVPSPTPMPTPLPRWKQLDRSMLKKIRLTPADEQIVVLAARQRNGAPSSAPHIMRVEITPGIVHQRSVMHIKVLTAATLAGGAEGVYFRFLIWEVALPPIGGYRLPRSDPDYPGRAYELWQRDYTVPAIPRWYRGRTYQVEVIATGSAGIASGAFVPVRVL
jgi:hypothetical protein